MIIYLGSDHNGFHLKEKIEKYLKKRGYVVVDEGGDKLDPKDDFTVYASRVINAMKSSSDSDSRGVLVCGSGQGMMIAANRFKGIRAGLGWSEDAAREVRNDEDSNVLAIPAEIMGSDTKWQNIIQTWLDTPFAGAARYKRRNAELDKL